MTKEQLRKTIGENIRSERIARNMSIDELAELLELTSGFVGLIERGRRGATAYNIYKLSEIFGLSVEKLFAVHESPRVKLNEDSAVKNKRNKLQSLSFDLTDQELDFLIQMVKMVRQLRNNEYLPMSIDEDEEEE